MKSEESMQRICCLPVTMWSEDQRCTPAYYFTEQDGKYVVGRYPGDEWDEFDDRFTACANFIVKAANLIW